MVKKLHFIVKKEARNMYFQQSTYQKYILKNNAMFTITYCEDDYVGMISQEQDESCHPPRK